MTTVCEVDGENDAHAGGDRAILSSIISMTEKGDGNSEKADAQHELENLRAHSAPTAIFGSSRRARMKSGEKNVAPPIPARFGNPGNADGHWKELPVGQLQSLKLSMLRRRRGSKQISLHGAGVGTYAKQRGFWNLDPILGRHRLRRNGDCAIACVGGGTV